MPRGVKTQVEFGKKVGRLTPLRWDGRDGQGRPFVLCECECECGNPVRVRASSLRGPRKVSSCGCLGRERTRQRCWRGHGDIPGAYWSRIKGRARDRGISFSLRIEEAWRVFVAQGGRCALSGRPIGFGKGGKARHTASLDRIDNARGYEAGNVQWVTPRQNKLKSDLVESDYIEECRAVARTHPPYLEF